VKSVLVPLKGGQCDEDVLRLAFEMTKQSKGKVYVLYVIEVERGVPVDAEVAPAIARGEEVLKHAEQWVKERKGESEAQLLQARQAGPAVIQEAVEHEVDAIIMPASYRRRYGSLGLGGTVPYVLKNAPCRVILWHEPIANRSNHADIT